MGVLPKKPIDRVQYIEGHIQLFTTNASAIGLTTAEVTDLGNKAGIARTAWDAHQLAQDAAKNATAAFYDALEVMSVAGAAAVKKIKAKAEQTGNPNVYTLASIPAPATPSPRPAPGTPCNFKTKLLQDGTLEIVWKCVNGRSAGTMYQVYRRTTPAGEFAYLGGTGLKRFVDAAIPAGTTQLTYQIQGVRSTAAGEFAQFNVNFGTAAAGGATASVAADPKLAA